MLVKRNPSVPLQEGFTTARRAVINVCIVLICDVCPPCSNDVFSFFCVLQVNISSKRLI